MASRVAPLGKPAKAAVRGTAKRGPAAAKAGLVREREAKPRVRLEVDARRAQLIALGLEAFSARPYDEVSLDELAQRAGISKGLLFHYFASKRSFYAAVIEHAADELLRRIESDPAQPPIEQLRAGLDAYLAYVDEHAAAFAALMRSGIGSDRSLARIVDRTRASLVDKIAEALPSMAQSPLVRTALRGWVGAVEAASLDWAEHRDVDRGALRALFESMLLAILGHAAARTDQ